MNTLTPSALALSVVIGMSLAGNPAQAQEVPAVRTGDPAFAFASGAIQKTTPRDGIVNLITGDNQSSTNRMFLGIRDTFYLKLNNPADAAVGDLFTIYKQVRKVFHPLTNQYLGFVMLRLAVVRVTDTNHALTTVQAVTSYGPVSPGDPVMRYVAPSTTSDGPRLVDTSNLTGMIVEIQSDKPMTMVSHNNVVYLDRGHADGLQIGDLLDIQRRSAGLPARSIGQLKVVATEDHTATARVVKATARVFKGDRVKVVEYSAPIAQPVEIAPLTAKAEHASAIPSDLVASKLTKPEASGESRINLGNLEDLLRYESGEAAIKPDGYKVLDQLIEHLRTSSDTRFIRVEGHTDNVEIGPSLQARYPSNVELSKARAGNVARYLIEKGSLDSARLQSVGYGDSKPVATNANEEGRSKNRRVEIVLFDPASEPPASPSGQDNHAQRTDRHPSELKPRGTMSTLPTPDPSAHEASGPENSGIVSTSTETQPQLDMEGGRPENAGNSDTHTVMPSDGARDAQDTTADSLGMTENSAPKSGVLPSDGQQDAQDTTANSLGMMENNSPHSNAAAQEADNQSSDAPLSLSMDSVGF